MASSPGNLRAVAGTNTDDVMKLFGGYGQDGQGKTTAANALSLIGGYGQPPSLADVMAQSIGAVNEQAKTALMRSPLEFAGTPGWNPNASTPSPATTPAATPAGNPARTAAATPLPTLRGLPSPPSVMDTLPVPVYDEARAQKENDKALRLASLVPALAALFNIGGGGARAMGPGLIAEALAGADAGTKEREARRLKTYGLEQDAQNIFDARTQRRYGQDADVVQEDNRNANILYGDKESASRADAADETRRAAIDQKGTAALLRTQAANRRALFGLKPDAQEALLTGPDAEQKYGVLPSYDTSGRYIPLTIQKDATNQQNADTNSKNAKSLIETRAGQLTINGRNASVHEKRLYQQGKLTNATIERYQNMDENAKRALDIQAQRANTYQQQADTARERSRQTALKAAGKGGDPVKAAQSLAKDIQLARKRQAGYKKDAENGVLSEEDARSFIDSEEDYIQQTRTMRDAAVDVGQTKGALTESAARAIKGLPPTTDTQGRSNARASRYPYPSPPAPFPMSGTYRQSSVVPVAAPVLTATQARRVSSRAASRSTGTVGPAKVVVPKRVGLTAEAAKGKSIEELLATMTGKKK